MNFKCILVKLHECIGHIGYNAIIYVLKDAALNKPFKEFIRYIINECDICNRFKSKDYSRGKYLDGHIESTKFLDLVSTDIFGPD